MSKIKPNKISIVMGSQSDYKIMKLCQKILKLLINFKALFSPPLIPKDSIAPDPFGRILEAREKSLCDLSPGYDTHLTSSLRT